MEKIISNKQLTTCNNRWLQKAEVDIKLEKTDGIYVLSAQVSVDIQLYCFPKLGLNLPDSLGRRVC